ncbi:MAG: replication initiation protein [Gammaproteobacteria bacterium]|nr:replication initiation protein [Gammaproteobacteria bacterium]
MALPKKQDSDVVEIKKHVNAIHSSNNISLVQRKVFNALLYNAYHDLPKKSQYEISVKLLAELIGYDSNDQKKLKNSLIGLITTAIEWNVLDSTDSDSSKWRASSIIASAKIEKGICTYEFSSVMRELLYHPEMYGKIDMNLMTKFKSAYGLALYENCIRFQGLSTTGWLSLAIFRKLMGIPDGRYPEFCDFKKRVLDIALREVNLYSHLNVSPEMQRVNKKVTSIRFKLSTKQSATFHVEHFNEANDLELIKILTEIFGLSPESVKDVLAKYEHDYIQGKIDLIKNSENFKSGKIRDLAAYFVDALKRDYKKSRSSKAVITELRDTRLESEKQEKLVQEKQKNKYNKYVSDLIENYVSSLADDEKNRLLSEFEQVCDSYALTKYKKHGLAHAAVKAIFNMFIKNTEASNKLNILSFDEYLYEYN